MKPKLGGWGRHIGEVLGGVVVYSAFSVMVLQGYKVRKEYWVINTGFNTGFDTQNKFTSSSLPVDRLCGNMVS